MKSLIWQCPGTLSCQSYWLSLRLSLSALLTAMNALGETSRANTFSKCGEGGPISMRHTQERRGGDYDGRQPRAGTETISSCSTLPSAHSGPPSFSLSLMMKVELTKQMLSAAYLQENTRPLQSVCWASSHSKPLNTFEFWLRNEIKSSVVSSGFSRCSSQSFKNFWPFPYWAPNVISWASDWKTDASAVAVSTVESHKPSQQCVDGAVSPACWVSVQGDPSQGSHPSAYLRDFLNWWLEVPLRLSYPGFSCCHFKGKSLA